MPAHKVAFSERQKSKDVRMSNIVSAKAVAAAVRTSLGPRGMDKMIQGSQGGVIITNDGATILRKMELNQPAAKMLQGLSRSQDIEAGDGTTSVVVIAGALLDAVDKLLNKAVHPTRISEAFKKCADKVGARKEDRKEGGGRGEGGRNAHQSLLSLPPPSPPSPTPTCSPPLPGPP